MATTLIFAALVLGLVLGPGGVVQGQHAGAVRDIWGEENCRVSLCSLMSPTAWHSCCTSYKQCCAYLNLLQPKDPFSFDDPEAYHHDQAAPDRSVVTVFKLPKEPSHTRRSSPLTDGTNTDTHPPQSQPSPRPRAPPRRQPISYSLVRPEDTQPPSPPENEAAERENEEMCRARFCGLLDADKHQVCCHYHHQCCAYTNLHRNYDPFHFETPPEVQ